MFELLLLIPFAAAAAVGIREFIAYRLDLRETGIEVPLALFSNKPPGEIRMRDWAQRQIEDSRKIAIEIGLRELQLPEKDQWEREFHVAIEASGGKRRNVIPGDIIIETSANGQRAISYQAPDSFHLDDCTCSNCRHSRRMAQAELETIDINELDW